MNSLTWLFLVALVAETAVRLWLSGRQIAAARASRAGVPEAFRGRIAPADAVRAADYSAARLSLGRIAVVFELVFKLALTLGGGIAAAQALVAQWPLSPIAADIAVVFVVMVALEVVGLPFALYRTFRIEARYGFNRMTPRLFILDLVKKGVLAACIGLPVLAVAFLLMQRAGGLWWVWAWLAWMIFSVALTWAAPRFIAPLFNKFSPLADAALRERLQVLLERCRFDAQGGLYVMNASLRSSHGNAYFTGIGRNKRIVLFDTLMSALKPAEVEAVLAHELGHFKLHHVRQQLVVSTIASLVGFGILALLKQDAAFYAAFNTLPGDSAALLLFALVLPVFTYFLTPLSSWWSRRHEFEADRFAARYVDANELANALVSLYRDNASLLTPDERYSAFYDSHPPALTRIARLKALKA